ncbi:MAG: GNAT family N-acetyltransferase [Chloroflexi bacterium]|nr:GNAT family N-acetyltransferase [Chloroflexota bacterium]
MTEATSTVDVHELDVDGYRRAIPELAGLIVRAVAHGASVNFTANVTIELAAAWWRTRIDAIASGQTTAFVAVGDGRIVGSTLLARSLNQNSPHRAEIGKVIVDPSVRRRGIARALMLAAEDRARADGRWLLVLDTVTGSPADSLYRSLDWQETGIVPDYALLPDGRPWPATFFWKRLR